MEKAEKKEKLCLLYDTEMEKHFAPESVIYTSHNNITIIPHPECPERIRRIWEALVEAGVVEHKDVVRLENGRLMSQQEFLMVHKVELWDKIMATKELDQEARDIFAKTYDSIYLNSSSIKCALLAAGGVLSCVDEVMSGTSRTGMAIVRPPGHHAEADTPGGFCIFNNVAIAAQYAVTKLGLERVLILDWDVHHGNGIQHKFYDDNKVLYMSLHRYDHATFYPQSEDANYDKVGEDDGKGFNVNIPWNDSKMGDSEYLLAFKNVIMPIAEEFQPQLILISAGFDAAAGDPLSGYQVTPAMYGHMTHHLAALAEGRVVLALEGGYSLSSISECTTQCAKALLGDPLLTLEVQQANEDAVQTVRYVLSHQKQFWKSLRAGAEDDKGVERLVEVEEQLENVTLEPRSNTD